MTAAKKGARKFCPACGRRLTASPRICGKCKKVIAHHHKYYFSGSTVFHKDCKNPTAYPVPL
jgi:predicted amidophosphoribosyltransferase